MTQGVMRGLSPAGDLSSTIGSKRRFGRAASPTSGRFPLGARVRDLSP